MSVSLTFTVAGQDAAKLKERIKEEALKEGMSMSEWIVVCIVEHLRRTNEPGA